jgi:hypothetical protein
MNFSKFWEHNPDSQKEIGIVFPEFVFDETDLVLFGQVSDSLLGGCPGIEVFSQIEAFFENKHRYTPSISRIIFKK